jgi:hypothetical protein
MRRMSNFSCAGIFHRLGYILVGTSGLGGNGYKGLEARQLLAVGGTCLSPYAAALSSASHHKFQPFSERVDEVAPRNFHNRCISSGRPVILPAFTTRITRTSACHRPSGRESNQLLQTQGDTCTSTKHSPPRRQSDYHTCTLPSSNLCSLIKSATGRRDNEVHRASKLLRRRCRVWKLSSRLQQRERHLHRSWKLPMSTSVNTLSRFASTVKTHIRAPRGRTSQACRLWLRRSSSAPRSRGECETRHSRRQEGL